MLCGSRRRARVKSSSLSEENSTNKHFSVHVGPAICVSKKGLKIRRSKLLSRDKANCIMMNKLTCFKKTRTSPPTPAYTLPEGATANRTYDSLHLPHEEVLERTQYEHNIGSIERQDDKISSPKCGRDQKRIFALSPSDDALYFSHRRHSIHNVQFERNLDNIRKFSGPKYKSMKTGGFKSSGQLELSISRAINGLKINVLRAQHLRNTSHGGCNTYVQIEVKLPDGVSGFGSKVKRTRVVHNSHSPVYDETILIDLKKEQLSERLHIGVWHYDSADRSNECLGCMSFGMEHLLTRIQSEVTKAWYFLLNEDLGKRKHLLVRRRPADSSSLFSAVPEILTDLEGMTSHTIEILRSEKSGFGFTLLQTSCPARVNRVMCGGEAAMAGLIDGDVIIRVHGQNVSRSSAQSVADLVKKSTDKLKLEIRRSPKSSDVESAYHSTSSLYINHVASIKHGRQRRQPDTPRITGNDAQLGRSDIFGSSHNADIHGLAGTEGMTINESSFTTSSKRLTSSARSLISSDCSSDTSPSKENLPPSEMDTLLHDIAANRHHLPSKMFPSLTSTRQDMSLNTDGRFDTLEESKISAGPAADTFQNLKVNGLFPKLSLSTSLHSKDSLFENSSPCADSSSLLTSFPQAPQPSLCSPDYSVSYLESSREPNTSVDEGNISSIRKSSNHPPDGSDDETEEAVEYPGALSMYELQRLPPVGEESLHKIQDESTFSQPTPRTRLTFSMETSQISGNSVTIKSPTNRHASNADKLSRCSKFDRSTDQTSASMKTIQSLTSVQSELDSLDEFMWSPNMSRVVANSQSNDSHFSPKGMNLDSSQPQRSISLSGFQDIPSFTSSLSEFSQENVSFNLSSRNVEGLSFEKKILNQSPNCWRKDRGYSNVSLKQGLEHEQATRHVTEGPASISLMRKTDEHINDVIDDIIESEISYSRIIQGGIQCFSRPLRHAILTRSQHSDLFQNIEKLAALSSYHLQRLSCGQIDVTSVFMAYASTLSVLKEAYSNYVQGYAVAMATAERCLKDLSFSEFVEKSVIYNNNNNKALGQIGHVYLERFITEPLKHVQRLIGNFRKLLEFCPSEINNNSSVQKDLKRIIEELEPVCFQARKNTNICSCGS